MIAINDYRQFIAELTAAASRLSGVKVSCVRLAVTEPQLVTLLKDLSGTVVAGKVPDYDLTNGGFWKSGGECLLMVLEKLPRDGQGTEAEYKSYERMQQLMSAILRLLVGETFQEFCDHGEVDFAEGIRVEWEFNTYGGFSGLSAVFHLRDNRACGL